ncbi:MAG: dephospho-CoA kinase [Mycobacteriaceae bacterium]
MLKVGLTGGIGAGKSTVAAQLAGLGAVVIDADRIAREVVEPGTPGLEAVVHAFGAEVLTSEGALDRAALAARVFGDDAARNTLNGVLHPLIGARTATLAAAAEPNTIVVHDVPLIVENRMATAFHLVLVVGVDEAERVRRLQSQRGMSEADARARVAAQASDAQRRAVADVWLDNGGAPGSLEPVVQELWHERLVPFERHVRERTWPRNTPVLVAADPTWSAQGARLVARLAAVLGERAVRVDHIGSTSVPGLGAKDVLDLQVAVTSLDVADAFADELAEAGFPRHPYRQDRPKVEHPDPASWSKRLHVNADPGRAANVHVRVEGSPGQRFALLFPAWLRAEPGVRAEYMAVKRAAAVGAREGLDYAEAKEPWFDAAYPRALAWAELTGWSPRTVSLR